MSISITTAFKTSIAIPYGELKSVIAWCQENCRADWQFQEKYQDSYSSLGLNYEFFFEDEKDYFAFLIWKK